MDEKGAIKDINSVFGDMLGLLSYGFNEQGGKKSNGWSLGRFGIIFARFYLFINSPLILLLQVNSGLDLETAVLSLSLNLVMVEIDCKVGYFFLRRKRLEKLCIRYDHFLAKGDIPKGGIEFLAATSHRLRKMVRIFYFVVYSNIVLWATSPLSKVDWVRGLFGVAPTPAPAKFIPLVYAFNITVSPNREIVFLTEMVELVGGCLCFAPLNMFFASVVVMMDAHIEVMIQFFTVEFEKCLDSDSEKQHVKKIVRCVTILNELVEELRRQISPVLVCVLLSSVVSTCVLSFQMTKTPIDSSQSLLDVGIELIRYASHILTILLELFMYCWLCSYTEAAVEKLHLRGLYNTDWYNKSISTQKSILMTMKQTHGFKPFTAMGLAVIKVNTFIDVLRVSYTYYTVLLGLKND